MAEFTTVVPQSLSTKGNVNQDFGIPAGDVIEIKTGFMLGSDGGKVAFEYWVIHESTLTGAAAFNSDTGYSGKAPNGSYGWDSAGTRVKKDGTKGLFNGTFA